MKWLAIIWSVYTLVLSAMPCPGGVKVVDDARKVVSIRDDGQAPQDQAYGGLLPEGKVSKVEELKRQGKAVAFVGDGINDAPVITLSDVGMAMGGLG